MPVLKKIWAFLFSRVHTVLFVVFLTQTVVVVFYCCVSLSTAGEMHSIFSTYHDATLRNGDFVQTTSDYIDANVSYAGCTSDMTALFLKAEAGRRLNHGGNVSGTSLSATHNLTTSGSSASLRSRPASNLTAAGGMVANAAERDPAGSLEAQFLEHLLLHRSVIQCSSLPSSGTGRGGVAGGGRAAGSSHVGGDHDADGNASSSRYHVGSRPAMMSLLRKVTTKDVAREVVDMHLQWQTEPTDPAWGSQSTVGVGRRAAAVPAVCGVVQGIRDGYALVTVWTRGGVPQIPDLSESSPEDAARVSTAEGSFAESSGGAKPRGGGGTPLPQRRPNRVVTSIRRPPPTRPVEAVSWAPPTLSSMTPQPTKSTGQLVAVSSNLSGTATTVTSTRPLSRAAREPAPTSALPGVEAVRKGGSASEKRRRETCWIPISQLQKIEPAAFHRQCREPYLTALNHHAQLIASGYDATLPLALVAYHNKLVSKLIERMDRGGGGGDGGAGGGRGGAGHDDELGEGSGDDEGDGEGDSSDGSTRRRRRWRHGSCHAPGTGAAGSPPAAWTMRRIPKAPGAVKRMTLPPVIPFDDPLADIREELKAALKGAGSPVRGGGGNAAAFSSSQSRGSSLRRLGEGGAGEADWGVMAGMHLWHGRDEDGGALLLATPEETGADGGGDGITTPPPPPHVQSSFSTGTSPATTPRGANLDRGNGVKGGGGAVKSPPAAGGVLSAAGLITGGPAAQRSHRPATTESAGRVFPAATSPLSHVSAELQRGVRVAGTQLQLQHGIDGSGASPDRSAVAAPLSHVYFPLSVSRRTDQQHQGPPGASPDAPPPPPLGWRSVASEVSIFAVTLEDVHPATGIITVLVHAEERAWLIASKGALSVAKALPRAQGGGSPAAASPRTVVKGPMAPHVSKGGGAVGTRLRIRLAFVDLVLAASPPAPGDDKEPLSAVTVLRQWFGAPAASGRAAGPPPLNGLSIAAMRASASRRFDCMPLFSCATDPTVTCCWCHKVGDRALCYGSTAPPIPANRHAPSRSAAASSPVNKPTPLPPPHDPANGASATAGQGAQHSTEAASSVQRPSQDRGGFGGGAPPALSGTGPLSGHLSVPIPRSPKGTDAMMPGPASAKGPSAWRGGSAVFGGGSGASGTYMTYPPSGCASPVASPLLPSSTAGAAVPPPPSRLSGTSSSVQHQLVAMGVATVSKSARFRATLYAMALRSASAARRRPGGDAKEQDSDDDDGSDDDDDPTEALGFRLVAPEVEAMVAAQRDVVAALAASSSSANPDPRSTIAAYPAAAGGHGSRSTLAAPRKEPSEPVSGAAEGWLEAALLAAASRAAERT